MSDYGGGSYDPSIGGQGGSDYSDPSAGGGFGGGFDPSAGGNDMGMGGWSPFGGSGGTGGGWSSPPPQNAIGSPADPATLSAQQGQQAQQSQQPQRPQPPSHSSQLADAIKSLVGGPQHSLSPSLQSLAQKGMGWFAGPSTPPSLGADARQVGTDLGFSPPGQTPPNAGAIPTWDSLLKGLFGGGATPGSASTGPTGADATRAAGGPAQPVPYLSPEQADAATGPAIPEGQVPLPTPDPRTQAPAAADAQTPQADAGTGAPDAGAAGAAGSPAPPSPQLPSVSGNKSGQPGPDEQVTGSTSSQEAAGQGGQGGQYGQGQQPWQNNPMFALLDLLRGDFPGLMRDLLGQQGVPANQNFAGAQRPTQYGGIPGAPQFAGPRSGTPSAGNPADHPAAATGTGTAPNEIPTSQLTPAQRKALGVDMPSRPPNEVPTSQFTDRQRAAFGLPPRPPNEVSTSQMTPAQRRTLGVDTPTAPTAPGATVSPTPGPQASLTPSAATPPAMRQAVSQPLGRAEIAYGSRGVTGRPSQPNVDRSSFQNQINDQTAYQLAWMINGEVGRGAPLRVKIVQGETAFNRAQMRNTSLSHALMPSRRAGDAGYYDGRSPGGGTYRENARPSAADVQLMKTQILPAIMGGSNLSDVGQGPMTGNASAGVAMHQFQRGTFGYKLHGGDTYFRERPFRPLPTLPAPPDLAQAS